MKQFEITITGSGSREKIAQELKNILALMEGNNAEIKYEQPNLMCEIIETE